MAHTTESAHRPRAGIRTDVANALIADPRIDGTRITVVVADDIVTLSGSVETRAQKQWADEIASAVAGVGAVRNELHVERQTDSAMAVFGEPSNTQGSGSLGE